MKHPDPDPARLEFRQRAYAALERLEEMGHRIDRLIELADEREHDTWWRHAGEPPEFQPSTKES